jgi:hypothetical protein
MYQEIWKPIEGYNGDYLISNYGRIKSFKSYIPIVLKLSKNNDGYLQVHLFKYGAAKYFKVHRLVAETFIENPNPEKYNQINHIDENKENNHHSNLEWCDCQYNAEYSNAKKYKILFPDNHKEIIFNLCKFCRENSLNQGSMNRTFKKGYFHKGFKILEIIEKDEIIKKGKVKNKKQFKILCPNDKIEIINSLIDFCKENNLNIDCMRRTFKIGYFHRNYKLIEIIT